MTQHDQSPNNQPDEESNEPAFEQLSFEPGDAASDKIIRDYHGEEFLNQLKEIMREEYRQHVAATSPWDGMILPGFSTLGEVAYHQAVDYAKHDHGPCPLPLTQKELNEIAAEDAGETGTEFADWTDEDWESL